MSLTKTNLDVLFTSGINNKIDSKILQGSALRTLENGVFTKSGTINKRPGYTMLNSETNTGTDITNMDALLTTANELLLTANKRLYSYSSTNDEWIDKDSFVSASVESSTITANAAQQTAMDSCVANNIALYAWEDTRNGIRYSVQDIVTGTYYIQDTELTSTGDTPRCVAISGRLFVFYGDSANLKFAYISTNAPATVTTGTTETDLHADHLLSVVSIGTKGYVWYKSTTANEGELIEVDNTGTTSHSATISATIIDTLDLGYYTSNGLTYLYPAYKETASLVKAGVYSQSLVELVAATAIDSTASGDVSKITMLRTNSTTDEMTFLMQFPGAAASDDYIKTNTLTQAGSAGTASVFLRSVGLASKIFTKSDALYVAVLHESDLQATVFIVNASGEVIGKFAPGNAGTHTAVGSFLPTVADIGSGQFTFLMNTKGTIRSENATIFSQLGLTRATIDFEGGNTFDYTTMNKNLLITGGVLSSYDGNTVSEAGFHLFPEGAAVTSTPTTAGSMSDGTYQYSFVYQWIDAKGNTHRSAPSVALSQTLSGGGSSQRIVMDIPTLRLTQKTSPVTLEVFRTTDGGSIFYRVSSITTPTENDTTADTVSFNDTLADSSITANEILYTTGGVLDNIAPPSCDIIVNHANRVFLAGLQDKNDIRYSKIVRTGEGVAFNEALSIPVDPRGGDITALASMDANLVILKRDNIYVVSGDGPSDTGSGATFTEPTLIAADVGCVDSGSVVLGPQGLYFKSTKGIYLLSRSLQTTYIGAQVEDFNQYTITSAQLLDDVNEVRFTTVDGFTLVFNYYFQQWSTFTSQNIKDSVIWDTKFVYLASDNTLHKESTTDFRDSGSPVKLKVGTGWVKLTGLQGFQRVYRTMVLGEYKTRHRLRMKIYVDYSRTAVQTIEFTPSEVLSVDSGFYGDGVYGVESPYGQDGNGVYQFQAHMKRQKCQAIRIEIEDVADNALDAGNTESLSLTGVSFQVGAKRGQAKLASGKQA
jgi:hypothetical protein